jgi:type IV pilus assembly protein PilB
MDVLRRDQISAGGLGTPAAEGWHGPCHLYKASMHTRRSTETKLLRFLVQNELLSREVAASAEAELAGAQTEMCVLDWLGRQGLIEEEHLAARMAERLRIPYVNLATQVFERDTLALLREDLATKHWVVPLRQEERSLIVAAANPIDHDAVRAVEFATGRRVRLVVATASAIADALNRAYHFDTTLSAYLQGVPGESDVPIAALQEEPADLDQLRRQTSLPPVVKLLNLILLDGIRTHASDIHIEATPTEVRVRYRIDGILLDDFNFTRLLFVSVVAC